MWTAEMKWNEMNKWSLYKPYKVSNVLPFHCYLLVKVGFADDNHVTLFGCLDVEEWRFSSDNRQHADKLAREGCVQVVLETNTAELLSV